MFGSGSLIAQKIQKFYLVHEYEESHTTIEKNYNGKKLPAKSLKFFTNFRVYVT